MALGGLFSGGAYYQNFTLFLVISRSFTWNAGMFIMSDGTYFFYVIQMFQEPCLLQSLTKSHLHQNPVMNTKCIELQYHFGVTLCY